MLTLCTYITKFQKLEPGSWNFNLIMVLLIVDFTTKWQMSQAVLRKTQADYILKQFFFYTARRKLLTKYFHVFNALYSVNITGKHAVVLAAIVLQVQELQPFKI